MYNLYDIAARERMMLTTRVIPADIINVSFASGNHLARHGEWSCRRP
jgi:hypothetical protein